MNSEGTSNTLNYLIGCEDASSELNKTKTSVGDVMIWNQAVPIKAEDGVIINVIFIDYTCQSDTSQEARNEDVIFMFLMLISSHLILECGKAIDS